MAIGVKEHPGGVIIPVWVQPRAKKESISGEHDGCLKVSVTAPPEDNRANKAVIKLLAKQLAIRKSAVHILSGEKSRRKSLLVQGISVPEFQKFLKSTKTENTVRDK